MGLVLALGLAEGGARLWNSWQGEPYDSTLLSRRLDALVQRIEGLAFTPKFEHQPNGYAGESLHPYQGFQLRSAFASADVPGDYYQSEEGRSTYDVLLFGGSVAAAFSNFSNGALRPLLEADPRLGGRKVRIHNRACAGHKQPQHTTNLQWALSLGIEPDAVVLLDGFNELVVANANGASGVHPVFPSRFEMEAALTVPLPDSMEIESLVELRIVRRDARELAARARRWGLLHSAIAGGRIERELERMESRTALLMADIREHLSRRSTERPPFVRGPQFDPDPASVRSASIRAWMEGSRTMQAACRARRIHFVHILQPSACDRGSKVLTENELRKSQVQPALVSVIETGYPLLREAGAQLAAEGVNFHDGTRMFEAYSQEIYLDQCHFERLGCRILGAFAAKALLDTLPAH